MSQKLWNELMEQKKWRTVAKQLLGATGKEARALHTGVAADLKRVIRKHKNSGPV